MGGCCAGFCQRLRRPGDTEKDDKLRRLILPVSATFIPLSGAAILNRYNDLGTGMWSAYVVGCVIAGAAFSCMCVFILTRMRGSYTTLVSVLALPITIGLLAIDLSNVSTMDLRLWPVVVIVMDVLIVVESKRWVQMMIVGFTLVWLTVVSVEHVAMFGLFEFGQIGNPDWTRVLQCDTPPCAIAPVASALIWLVSATVFLLDYHLTRGFATGLRHQLEVNSATVRVSERLVQLLADYSTEDARKLIEAEGMALPEELHASYEQLLDNLDSYRVFLPDALLYSQPQQQHGKQGNANGDGTLGAGIATSHPVRTVAPGQGAPAPEEVAMCFTDIQSSTELWEAHPQAMYTGLIMHNEVMRVSYAACNGYEVKTIGDSFMVAFDGPFDAVRFGLEAQMGLLRQEWPEALLTHPLCAPALSSDGTPLWGGLRVRIGVQYGSVRPEVSPVTGRCDYFGHTVNTAARLESVLKNGGLVATSDTVVSALRHEGLAALGSPVLHDAGPRELKGVREPLQVWALAPLELAERVQVLQGAEPQASPRTRPRCSRPLSSLSGVRTGSLVSSSSSGEHEISRPLRSRLRRLQSSAATCAAIRLSLCNIHPVSEVYQNLAAAATVAADRTQGVVDSVVSATVTVTWNTSRPCADHVGACRCFLGTSFRMPCHLGATSGQVLWGNITAGRRSFATVIGGCVELATALAEEAERCGDNALVTGEVADSCFADDAVDWAQLWQAPGCPPMVVMAARFSDTHDLRFAGNITRERTDTVQANSIAGIFRKACAGEPGSPEQRQALEQLEEIGDQPAGGGAAAALAERIRKGGVRTRAMPRLWMGGQDAQQPASPVHVESVCSSPELVAAR